jgi:predicted nucleic acid-binding protein
MARPGTSRQGDGPALVALIIDAGGLYAQADADEPRHASVAEILRTERETLVTTELAVAEADYLILERLGVDVELAFIEDLAAGSFVVECLSRDELQTARDVAERYRDLRLGLADASLVVLAQRYASTRILTFDERAFRVVAPLQGGAFTILPADLAT